MELGLELKPMKKTLGRQKITMKKIEKQSSLQVTFTKRRQGLFRKASELAILCGAEVGIIVQSPANKVYTFGEPSLETLINRISPKSEGHHQIMNPKSCHAVDDGSNRRKYEEAARALEAEEGRAAAMGKEMETSGRFWWEYPIEDLELDQLEEFLEALKYLSHKVAMKSDEFKI